jgi:hypothetical protein
MKSSDSRMVELSRAGAKETPKKLFLKLGSASKEGNRNPLVSGAKYWKGMR